MTENKQHRNLRRARPGDIVTIDMRLEPENGYVPESLFDASGITTFVLGWGNYLPGLHELVEERAVGESIRNVSVDAGYGDRRDDLIIEVPKSKLQRFGGELVVGRTIEIKAGMQVLIVEVRDATVVLDANPALAGSSYSCSFDVLDISPLPSLDCTIETDNNSKYKVCSFALGCFWGAELAFLRQQGVVGTKVGYSQGITANPSYDAVCTGRTKHRETTLVVYDSTVVSYEDLLYQALERLAVTEVPAIGMHSLLQRQEDEENPQYRHGIYYYTEEQRRLAQQAINDNNNRFGVELLQASTFYDGEEYHQKYLYKGGQSTRKGCKEPIRCYG